MMKNHPFHLVDYSPWPILGSLSPMIIFMGIIKWFHFNNMNLMTFSFMAVLFIVYQWWRDITSGHHTMKVSLGMRWGMILFIVSEIFYFIFFWGFLLHSSLSSSMEFGMSWPPMGIVPFNPLEIPLLNTIILLSLGLTVAWAQHSLMENNYYQTTYSLTLTVMLGLYLFVIRQSAYRF